MKKRNVNVILKDGKMPLYATPHSAGADLYAANKEPIVVEPLARTLIPTGVFMEMPVDSEAQVRPRSGLSLKEGVIAILGTIDSDYQGEIGVILINLGDKSFTITEGDRVGQIVFNGKNGLFQANWVPVSEFTRDSKRGAGGFGHTGIK